MKRKTGPLILCLLFAASSLLLTWAHRVGETKLVFAVTPLTEPVQVPIIHELYAGRAERVDDHHVRVNWNPVRVAGRDTLAALDCIGRFVSGTRGYYLLEAGGRLYAERAEFIAPLLAAREYHLEHGRLPAEFEALLDDPEFDRDRLGEFLAGVEAGARAD